MSWLFKGDKMRAKYLLVICSLLMIVFVTACTSGESTTQGEKLDSNKIERNNTQVTELSKNEIVNNTESVSMTIKEDSVLASGITLLFKNNTDKELTYGEFFVLEKQMDDEWYEMPIIFEGYYGFTAIGLVLKPSQTREWSVDWEWLYGKLASGDYRIVKGISEIKDTGDNENFQLAAEFTID